MTGFPLDAEDRIRLRRPIDCSAIGYSKPMSFDERFPPITDERLREILDSIPPRTTVSPKLYSNPHTYLIGAEGSHLVKIGWAKIPEARLRTLQTGQPMTLSLLWTQEGDYERKLHWRFAKHRVRGEWFDLTPLGDPVEVVKAAVAEIEATAVDR